jgi:NAD(P)-dependent dehydrogenase (short-subunit alcohol dehydrogenase family)
MSESKVAIVTGSNTGIGKETARGLAAKGYAVVMACRDVSKAEAARADVVASTGNQEVSVMALDLGDKAKIRAFAAAFRDKYGRLDVLVNNAGVYVTKRGVTADGMEMTFGVNHVGTFLLTRELLPVLQASAPARIVILSSKLHFRGKMVWEDLQFEKRKYDGMVAYNDSKLANVLFTKALARRLEGTKVIVNAVHPGVVATDLLRDYPKLITKILQLFFITPEKGATSSLHAATAAELAGVTGEYFDEKKHVVMAAKAALDEEAQERLWKITEGLAA